MSAERGKTLKLQVLESYSYRITKNQEDRLQTDRLERYSYRGDKCQHVDTESDQGVKALRPAF